MIERGTLLPKYAHAVPEGVTRTPPTDPGTDSCGSKAPSVNMNQHSEIRLEIETGQQSLTYSKRERSANWRSSVYEDDRDAPDAIALSAATALLGLLPNTKEGNHINLPRSFCDPKFQRTIWLKVSFSSSTLCSVRMTAMEPSRTLINPQQLLRSERPAV